MSNSIVPECDADIKMVFSSFQASEAFINDIFVLDKYFPNINWQSKRSYSEVCNYKINAYISEDNRALVADICGVIIIIS